MLFDLVGYVAAKAAHIDSTFARACRKALGIRFAGSPKPTDGKRRIQGVEDTYSGLDECRRQRYGVDVR